MESVNCSGMEMNSAPRNCCCEVMSSVWLQDDGYNESIPAINFREIYQIIICTIVMSTIIAMSILGNTAVILAIYKTEKLKEDMSSLFLINLSITDLFSAIFVMPYTLLALMTDDWMLGDIWCSAQCAFNYCCIIVSMVTLAFISVDRQVAIVYPLRFSSLMTKKLIYIMIAYAWILGIAFAIVPLICQWVVYDYWEMVCAIDWDSYRDKGGLTYVIVAFIVCFMIPATVMTLCYIRIYKEISNHYKRQAQHQQHGSERVNEQRKILVSFSVVVVMFFICTTPFCLTKVIKIFSSSDAVHDWINVTATYMQYLASATNPFICAIFRSNFRVAFARIFCRTRIRVDAGTAIYLTSKKDTEAGLDDQHDQQPPIVPVTVVMVLSKGNSEGVKTERTLRIEHEMACVSI